MSRIIYKSCVNLYRCAAEILQPRVVRGVRRRMNLVILCVRAKLPGEQKARQTIMERDKHREIVEAQERFRKWLYSSSDTMRQG